MAEATVLITTILPLSTRASLLSVVRDLLSSGSPLPRSGSARPGSLRLIGRVLRCARAEPPHGCRPTFENCTRKCGLPCGGGDHARQSGRQGLAPRQGYRPRG